MSSNSQPQTPSINIAIRFLFIASLLLLLLTVSAQWYKNRPLPSSPAVKPGPKDYKIIPGQRVGFITLGLSIKQALQELGQGQIRPHNNALLYIFKDKGVSIAVQNGKTVSILVTSPNFHTANGLKVGDDVDQVIRTYGKCYEFDGNAQEYILHYWAAGIHFKIKNTAISSIQVSSPIWKTSP